jgi:hypothetical protein
VAIRRRLQVAVCLIVALLALLLGGCGAQARVILSALDSQAINVAAAGSPSQLPSRAAGVPPGFVLEMTQWIARSGGRELVSQQWLDFENHRARSDNYGDATSILDGPTTTAIDPAAATILYSAVVDDIQEMTYDAHSTELRSNPVTAEGAFGGSEFASGASDVVLLGRQALGGVQVDVYRVDLNIPRGQERSADFGLIYADSATGLRLREEWLLGSPGRAWVYHMYEYRLLPRTPEIEARMEPEALIELAAQALAGHMAEIAELDFPVWGLPAGAHGLVPSGATIVIGDKGTSVRLEYVPKGFIGPGAVSVETNDLRSRADFSSSQLISREQAIANSGGTDHIDFLMPGGDARGDSGNGGNGGNDSGASGDTAVRILLGANSGTSAEPLILATLAAELIDVRQAGR